MTATVREGLGYRYLPAIEAFSAGVAAEDGYALGRLDLATPLPLPEAFGLLDRWLAGQGLAPTALVATHLRSPAAVDDDGFAHVNGLYRSLLADRGILHGVANPVARSNVAPAESAPRHVVVQSAFVVIPGQGASGDFVVSGASETTGGSVTTQSVVGLGDTSPEAMRLKVDVVLDTMLARLDGLGQRVEAPTHVNVYTVRDAPRLHERIAERIPAARTVGFQRWHAYPPVLGMEFEMDLHRVSWTRVIAE